MVYFIVKLGITAILVVLISEIAKRSSFAGALLASIPIVSVLAITWLYIDTGDVSKVGRLAASIFWLVIPSLAFFVSLPLLLKYGVNFYLAMGVSVAVTIICYFTIIALLGRYNISL